MIREEVCNLFWFHRLTDGGEFELCLSFHVSFRWESGLLTKYWDELGFGGLARWIFILHMRRTQILRARDGMLWFGHVPVPEYWEVGLLSVLAQRDSAVMSAFKALLWEGVCYESKWNPLVLSYVLFHRVMLLHSKKALTTCGPLNLDFPTSRTVSLL